MKFLNPTSGFYSPELARVFKMKTLAGYSVCLRRHGLFIELVIFVIVAGSFLLPLNATAQITPKGRDQVFKQAAPDRFIKSREKLLHPQSTIIPVEPDTWIPLHPEELKKVKFKLTRLVIQGATVYRNQQFFHLYKNFLGKQITLQHIYRIADAITKKYRNAGYILTKAIVPPQEIYDGTVRLNIMEGYIHNVRVQGRVVGPKKLLNAFRKRLMKSRPLHAKDLERYLLLIDDLAGVSVKSVLTPSKNQPGASDLTLILENKPFTAHAGVDNRGTKFNGPFQFFAGASENSLLGFYEKAGVQGVITSNPEELYYFNVFYEAPVSNEGTTMNLSAAFSQSKPGSGLKIFNVEGESHTFSFRLNHPFIRSRGENLRGHLSYTHRNTETDILGTRDSEDRLRILKLGMVYDYTDRFHGINLISFNISQGLNILDATEPGSLNLTRSQGRSDFTKISGKLQRLQQLAPSWMLLGSAAWQYSFEKLLASEEFGVGGVSFGRAFDPSEITGDTGLALGLELQRAFDVKMQFLRNLQAYVFFDYGSVWNRIATPTGAKQQDLASAGVGTRFNLTKHVSGYVEVAKPLIRDVATEGNRDPRVFFSLSTTY
ncbi:MAG: ShlB/FhaC/HecB family hemolysin secretion/activation protein [Nitrospinae bacterium]|nr:ShlB/FhaC/HecB family hemolysin secretion/activation protein [Nitrospinota bacterium]